MASSEEQQVATAHQEETRIGQCQTGKALRPQTLECLLLLLCLYVCVTTIYLWYLARREWVWGDPNACNVVCLSHGDISFY